MGQGRFHYEFVIKPMEAQNGIYEIAKAAQVYNENPIAISFFPPGDGVPVAPSVKVEGDVIVSAVKRCECDDAYILRFYEPVGNQTSFTIKSEAQICTGIIEPFEIKTFKISNQTIKECNLIEEE